MGLTGASVQLAGRGGYMGQIVDACAQLAQVAAKEEQIHVKLKMSRCELGKLEKH